MKKTINRLFAVIISLVAIVGIVPCELNVNATDNDIINVTVSGTYDYDAAFEYLDLVNELRAEKGYEKWQMTTELLEVAMRRAQEASLYLQHEKPDGTAIMFPEVLTNVGITPQDALNSFKNSSPHFNAIMMNDVVAEKYGKHYYTGVGCYKDDNGRRILIQCLMTSDGSGEDRPYTKDIANEANYSSEKIVTNIIPVKKELMKPGTCCVAKTYKKNPIYNNEYECSEYNYEPDSNVGNIKIKMLNENDTTISSSNFNYSSSNLNVATVDPTGQYKLANVGIATIRATFKDDESIYFERNITVKPKNLSNLKIKYQNDDTIFYDGTPKTPKITIDNLVENRDYVVEYENNIGDPSVASSIAKVIVTGINNYTGVKTDEFQIISNSKCVTYGEYWDPPYYDEELGCYVGGYDCIGWHFNHKYSSDWIIDKEATCLSEGIKSHHCAVCGDKKDITLIPKTAHSYKNEVTKQPTCTATGVMTYTCSICGDSYTETIPAIGHSYSKEWTVDKPATCIAEGSKSHHCTVCGTKKDITVIPKVVHNYTSKITKQPTCTEYGVRTYTCSGCNDSYTESIPATGHKFSDWKTDTPNACITGGIKIRTCSVCGKVEKEEIKPAGHKYSLSWTIDKSATCTTEGSKSHHCTVCGDKKDITPIPKVSHQYDDGKITVKPTCITTGVKVYTCKNCGDIKTETIAKISHNYISEVTKEPTCTENGEKKVFCTICNESHLESVLTKGHNYTTTVIKPSYTSNGYTIHTCSECGETFKDNFKNKLILTSVSEFKVNSNTNSTVKLTWNKVSNADGYIVYKYDNAKKKWLRVIKTKNNSNTYTVSKLKAGTTYKFAVKAYKTEDEREITSQKYPQLTTSTSLANITKTNFKSSANTVKMNWGKVTGATGYRVYKYNTFTRKWQGIANVKGTSYTFKNLKAGTTCKFTVRAYKTLDKKTYLSPKYSTFTSSTNPATVNFKLTAGTKKATVKWSKVTGASGYKVYYKTSKNGKWIGLKTVNNKTTNYTKTKLAKGKTYFFTVKAYRTTGGKTYNASYITKSVKIR